MKKYVQANQVPFKTKKISKQIMKRSRLRNKLNRKADIDRKGYNIVEISKVIDSRVF